MEEKAHYFTRNDYKILAHLHKQNCVSRMTAYPTKKIAKDLDLSYSKVKHTLLEFSKKGYVAEGIKARQAKTYYVTMKGTEILKELSRQ